MKNKLMMKHMKLIKKLIACLFVGVFLVAGALLAHGVTWWDGEQKILEVLVKGANLHLSRQGPYTNACCGSYGPPDVLIIENTWEWIIGSGETCWNVGGISATGLLAAYERTHKRDYLVKALLQGDTLVEKYKTIIADGADWDDRPFSQDIEFLVRLSLDSRNWSYARVARDWYKIITDNRTATEIADRYIDARASLAGWDLASQIRAALSVGEWRYARDMAKRLLERRTSWEGVPYADYDYTISSYTSLLWAFQWLQFMPEVAAATREFRGLVLAAQGLDGSWEGGDYQTTAYAILGLDATDMIWPGKREVRIALGMAFAFLRCTQTDEGGWSYPPEYGEVNSEVLMAVGGLRQWEVILPHGDPAPGMPQKPAAEPLR